MGYRLGVVAVDMKDRRLHHFGDIGAVQGRARIQQVAGGEADLIVDDDVNGAAGGVAASLGQVEGLHHHALAGERGVAMQDNGQDLLARLVIASVLTGPDGAFNHGVDDLQMGGVERQGQVHHPAGGLYVR